MSPAAAPKRIVFDFGAVLFHWQPAQMLRRELPHVVTDAASASHWETQFFQGYTGDWGEFDRGTVGVPDLVQRISRRTGLAPADVQKVVDAVPRELQPVPATVALLQRLQRAGHVLHYLSNMPEPYARHLEASHDVLGCFTSGIFSSRVHHNKPEPAIYAAAMQLFDVPASELVLLDDSAQNVAAARALGWHAFQFTDAAQAEADLRLGGHIDANT